MNGPSIGEDRVIRNPSRIDGERNKWIAVCYDGHIDGNSYSKSVIIQLDKDSSGRLVIYAPANEGV